MSIVENDEYISQRRVRDGQQDPDRIHSQASDLDSPVYAPGDTDDTVHLTSQDAAWKLGEPYERDIERRRGRRGPGARDGALKAMSKSIKRASIRVVNFANTGLDDRPVRLEDVDDQIEHREELLQRPAVTALRGKTLAVFGPTNRMRLAMYKLLSSTWVPSESCTC
jgi:WD40 repeat protein